MMDAVEFLYEMVKLPSLSTHEYLVSGMLRKRMKELGIPAYIDSAGNAVSAKPEEEASCGLLIFSHMDTVYPLLPSRRTEKAIFGRGAVDAKGPLCALLHAYAEVKDELPYSVVFAGVTEEESTTSKGARHLLTYVKPKTALLGEPSNLNGVTLAYKGRLVARISVKGEFSHAASPKGNPIDTLLDFYSQLRAKFPVSSPYNSTTITPTHITFGTPEALNVVPDAGRMTLDIRFPPSVDRKALEDALSSDSRVEVEIRESIGAAENSMNEPLARALVKSIRDSSLSPRYVKKSGSCDMNILVPMGIPTIAYGPGDSEYDHSSDEQIQIEDYLKSIEVIKGALRNLKFKE
jgi:[amino group carrier protein]-lysine/ornithine hydrolase